MSAAAVTTLALAAIAAATNWRAVMVRSRPVEFVAKPLTIVLLIATALLIDPADDTQRDWFVGALVASLVGDVALMLPSADESAERSHVSAVSTPPLSFVVGLGAFVLAHLGYVGGLSFRDLHVVGLAAGAVVVIVAAVSAGSVIIRASARRGDAVTTAAIVLYLLAIGAMVVVAYGTTNPFAIAGATLFFLSDALIGWNRFVRTVASARLVIMVTYHLGQAGLVLALLR